MKYTGYEIYNYIYKVNKNNYFEYNIMQNTKYLIANIRIPMAVFENQTYETLMDYVEIEFTHCNKLPEKSTQITETASLKFNTILSELFKIEKNVIDIDLTLDQNIEHEIDNSLDPNFKPIVYSTIEESELDPLEIIEPEMKLTVKYSEIQKKPTSKNTTFKSINRTHHTQSFSLKNRSVY